MTLRRIPWKLGEWTVPPVRLEQADQDLLVECAAGSDLWRTTSYGFVHDDAHGLLAELPDGSAMEVSFVLGGSEQFDQAGLLLRADPEHWVKAGVEHADGHLNVGAVVTDAVSDWSTWPVGWSGREVWVRASRLGDAVTIRAHGGDGRWQLVRLAPIDPTLPWRAGPFAAAPSRAGLEVRFTGWWIGPADPTLHSAG
jgi:regulation of enolase protein 1 (concanavalin A-like superfamily)